MKSYLMKWFDMDEYIDYEVDKYKKNLYERFDYRSGNKDSFVKHYIQSDLKLNYDSICSDTSLVKLYLDQAISKRADEEKNDLLKRKKYLLPPHDALYLHASIAYPESYKIIKNWWYQYNKTIANQFSKFNDLFTCLLIMNDTEAQSEFDKIIKKYVKANGEIYPEYYDRTLLSCLRMVRNAYSVKKLLEILPVTKKIENIAGEPFIPLDYETYYLLKEILRYHKVEVKAFSISPISLNMTDDEYIKFLRKNKKDIVNAANQLIKKMEEEEKYWMENIPFDYVPEKR
jgi:hypothetical protein